MLVPKDLTIYTAAELKPALLAEARTGESPLLDLSNVAELDSAGVQLLYLADREASAAGRTLRLVGCTPAVREILDLVGFPLREEAVA
jgi:anti-sigma B factor antagonist